jgi:glycerol kinase
MKETTALGAAYAAGLAVGFYKNLDDLCCNWAVEKIWKPNMDTADREGMYKLWKKAVTRTFDWVEEPSEAGLREKEFEGVSNRRDGD